MYEYNAEVIRVIDGDTVVVNIDLGLWTTRTETVRLYGINAPEVRGEEREQGLRSEAALVNMLEDCGYIVKIQTIMKTTRDEAKLGKYGRLLAILYPRASDFDSLNFRMVNEGFAEFYDTEGKKKLLMGE